MDNNQNIQQLRYTNVEGYINSQNEFGNSIQKLLSQTYMRRGLIFVLFEEMQAYFSRNSSYIKNFIKSDDETKKPLKEQLREIRNVIYTKEFKTYIREYEQAEKQGTIKTSKEFDSIFNFLEDSFLKVNRDFSNTHLNPEAVDVTPEKEEWEKVISNKAKREYLKACTDMFNQNRKKSVNMNRNRMGKN